METYQLIFRVELQARFVVSLRLKCNTPSLTASPNTNHDREDTANVITYCRLSLLQ